MKIKSPLTFSTNTEVEKTIPVNTIINLYKKGLGIDVTRFFTHVKDVYVYKCNDSGYRFYYPFDLSGDGKFYEELQNLPGYYPEWKWEHSKVEEFIKKNDKVLEIGCAEGSFIEKIKSNTALSVGLELNEKAVEIGNKKGLTILNESIQEHSKINKGKYDIVCSFQVMEHITAIHEVIQASVDALKIGGSLFISVPNNDSFINFDEEHILNLPPHHMCLWNKQSLKSLEKFFSLKFEDVFYEAPIQAHKPLLNDIINKMIANEQKKRILKYGFWGKVLNLLLSTSEYKRLKMSYPTLDNFTIISKFTRI